MKREAAGREKPGRPHSERVGEGLLASGARATLYRALVDLNCSRCGGLIREGTLFTREAEAFSGLPIVRCCRACAPFSAAGGLLEALLAPEGVAQARADAAEGAREKALARLAPALASGRKRRGGPSGGRGQEP
ncbi:MAG: hypothetical protein M3379_10245 [Acidobacteriota bacterium]|nr:hypothetical protein [Acidobacteriota bacterium]